MTAVRDADRSELRRALRSPLRGELLRDLGEDGRGRDEVAVGLDARHVLGVVEAHVEPLCEEVELCLRRHHDLEFSIKVGHVERAAVESRENHRVGGCERLRDDAVVSRVHVQDELPCGLAC